MKEYITFLGLLKSVEINAAIANLIVQRFKVCSPLAALKYNLASFTKVFLLSDWRL